MGQRRQRTATVLALQQLGHERNQYAELSSHRAERAAGLHKRRRDTST